MDVLENFNALLAMTFCLLLMNAILDEDAEGVKASVERDATERRRTSAELFNCILMIFWYLQF